MYNNNYGKGVDFLLYSALHWGFLKKQCFLQLSFLGETNSCPTSTTSIMEILITISKVNPYYDLTDHICEPNESIGS